MTRGVFEGQLPSASVLKNNNTLRLTLHLTKFKITVPEIKELKKTLSAIKFYLYPTKINMWVISPYSIKHSSKMAFVRDENK